MSDSQLFDSDLAAMRHALSLAHHAIGLSDPNPRVGCVLTDAQGRLLGQGHTQQAGGPHAEVMALQDARARGADVRGGTAYVTLEPCAHFGRTPPCCDALVAAGLAKVVVALEDPNPLVAGQGSARLRAAGLHVEVGLLAAQAHALNIGFFSRMQRARPWVRLKAAVSLDGRTSLNNGKSQWITGEAARTDGHAWRKRAGALLTGYGTVRDDDPRLDVRLVPTARQPLRVVVDSRLETPPNARILAAPGDVLLYGAVASAQREAALAAAGAQVVLLPQPNGKVDLRAVLRDLAQRGVNELHVEAGHLLSGSMVREGLVDEFLTYVAPKLLGRSDHGLASFGPLDNLAEAVALQFTDIQTVGGDLRLLARPATAVWPGPLPALSLRRFHPLQRRPRRPPRLMFTGIITGLGQILDVRALGEGAQHGLRLCVQAPAGYLDDVQLGDSIALNGACMTVTTFDVDSQTFTIDISAESLDKTTGLNAPGPINLEKALRANDRLGGHLVSGHVDGLGTVTHFAPVGESWELRIQSPAEMGKYLAYKGSITVNGVSLTVNRVQDSPQGCEFSINLIPHTIDNTALGHLKAGTRVNLEIDLIARYVERMLSSR